MKILLAMDGPKTHEHLGVYARRYVPLFHLLSESGIDLHVALLGDEAGAQHQIAPSVTKVYPLPSIPISLGGLWAIPPVARKLRRILTEVQPSIAEGSEPLPAIAMGFASRIRERPVIVYRRHHGARTFRLVLASRLAAHLADRTVVTNGPMSEQAAKDDRIPIDRVLIARSGTAELRSVEKYEITRTREALGIPPEAKIVAAIGRMRPEKGMDALVDAVDRITLGGFHLVLVGSGPEEPALKEAASACRHPVHLLGHQSDVALWFHLSDIIAIPSRAESFGRVTVEAMCAGRPIVASRVGGLVEAVEDGATGLLVTPNQPQELANALERLLKDDELRARMGSAARKRFEVRYSMASMAEEWRAVWEQAHRVRSPVGETAA